MFSNKEYIKVSNSIENSSIENSSKNHMTKESTNKRQREDNSKSEYEKDSKFIKTFHIHHYKRLQN